MRKMKNFLTVFLCICLMFMTVPENAFINWQNVKASDYDGDGEDGEEWDDSDDGDIDDDDSDASNDDNSGKDTPVLPVTTPQPDHAVEVPQGYVAIYNIDELYAVRNGLDQNYILMNDIDMTTVTTPGGEFDNGNGWKPIENFTGNFDGNGYRIIGMHIFGDMKENNVGLFGSASGNITNLGMKNCDIDVSNTDCVGGIVGKYRNREYGYENSEMSQCYVSGKIQIAVGDNIYSGRTGGLIGEVVDQDIHVTDCYNAADIIINKQAEDVETEYYLCGGIIGEGGLNTQCVQSYNIGSINDGEGYGICGGMTHDYYNNRITNCFYLAGKAKRGHGGYEEDGDEIDATPIAQESQMKKKSFFTKFDFDNTWEIDSFCAEYPYPQLRRNRQVCATSVVLKKLPSKLSYMQGDPAAFSDGEIEITYENGMTTEINIDESMLSGYDLGKIGKQTVILSFAGFQTQFSIEVREIPVTGIKLNQTKLTLGVSESKMLMAAVLPANATNKEIIWKSFDEKIATVSNDGIVVAKKKGETTITAYSFDKKKSASCEVTVNVPCVKLTFGEYNSEMYPGGTQKISVSMQPLETEDDLTWISSNQNIATIDETGNVTAVAAGKVDITATADSGVSEKCTILVKEIPTPTPDAIETPAPDGTGTPAPDETGTTAPDTIKTSIPSVTSGPAETTEDSSENGLQKQINKVKIKIVSVTKAKKTSAVLKLKGSNTSQVDGYQIKVKQKDKKAYVKTINVCQSYRLKGLKKKKKYTVKVRAYVYNEDNNSAYYGPWSSEKSFRMR